MMSCDKYERGRQHLSGGHQRVTCKKKIIIKIKRTLTLRLTQINEWVGVDHAALIQLVNSPQMTGCVEKIKWL